MNEIDDAFYTCRHVNADGYVCRDCAKKAIDNAYPEWRQQDKLTTPNGEKVRDIMTCKKHDCGFYRKRAEYCILQPSENVNELRCNKYAPSDSRKLARALLIDSMLHIDKFNIGTAKDLILRVIDMLEKTD